jgi:hypothetical protein
MEKIDGLKNEHQNVFWNDSSLLSDILKDNYEKEGKLEAQLILKKQFLTNLSQWKKLSKEDKSKYPDGLKVLLDEVCGIENLVECTELHDFEHNLSRCCKVQRKVYFYQLHYLQ